MASYQNVDVFVFDRACQLPLGGVLVRVLSADGTAMFTECVTDETGRASFLLCTNTYSLRFYRFQTRFQMPQIIEVCEGPDGSQGPNAFNVYGEVLVIPVANDPHLCRVSGFFRDITGAPHRGLAMIFIGEFSPILLAGSGVLSERRELKTDEQGYACVDLIRCAKYSATIQGYEDHTRSILVPDAPSANLPAVLFAMVDLVYFDLPSPWTLSVGSEISLNPTVVTNSKIVTRGTDLSNVSWKVEDPSIVSLAKTQHTLILRGLRRGHTKLIATRSDWSIVTVPFKTHIQGSDQSIFVD